MEVRSDSSPRGNKRLWLPFLIALLGVATTVSAWGTLRKERRAREAETLASIASNSRASIEAAVERQIDAMRDLATSGSRSPEAWRVDARRALAALPELDSIAWVGPDGTVVRAAVDELSGHASEITGRTALVALAGEPPPRQGVVIAGPLGSADTGWRYQLVTRAADVDRTDGVLVANVSVQRLLTAVLRDSAPGYAISAHWGDAEIYRRGESGSGHPWWENRGAVTLSPGAEWQTIYRPTPSLIATVIPLGPGYFLAGGILISLMLGVLVHQLRSAEGEVRSLDDLNRELERRVDVRTRELAAAVGELEAFNYSVSHDLRSPLGSILTFAAVLEEDFGDNLDADACRMLERIRASAETSIALLDGLLELSRAGRDEMHAERIDLAVLARETWAEIATGDEGAVQLEIDAPLEAWGDPPLLRQLLANLLRNGLRFSAEREQPLITIGGEQRDGERVYFVSDNGAGFDMRFSKKLFQPFERLHGDSNGSGVGLAVVRRIVERHGGRVWADGKPDAGATFFFTLPWKAGA